jgi:ubiquitin carboxyl-terminal hydrolase 5/13
MGTVSEADLGKVRQHMSKAKAPQRHDKVYKDECMFSFDTPESPGGLYIGLTSFQVCFVLQSSGVA